jgi:hypothetical protein
MNRFSSFEKRNQIRKTSAEEECDVPTIYDDKVRQEPKTEYRLFCIFA